MSPYDELAELEPVLTATGPTAAAPGVTCSPAHQPVNLDEPG
jgi:hypothetical protein